jgi:hypothetical protein
MEKVGRVLAVQKKPYRTYFWIGSNPNNQCQLSSKFWRISRFLWWLRIEHGKVYLQPSGHGHKPRIVTRHRIGHIRHPKITQAIADMKQRIASKLAKGYERAPRMWDEEARWRLRFVR